jgi:methylated-DNA-[protein]-cysteine S-methyltransferase
MGRAEDTAAISMSESRRQTVGGRRQTCGMERRAAWISVPSPIGDLGVAADAGEITAVHFGGVGRHPITVDPAPVLKAARQQFEAYFAGRLTDFDLPLAVPGGSDFEQAVWKAIAEIGYADMATYGDIAKTVGDKDAARAVGVACNRNPVPIIVPCHRVVGAGGKLVGFGGGLDRKRFLLQLEARVRVERDFQ